MFVNIQQNNNGLNARSPRQILVLLLINVSLVKLFILSELWFPCCKMGHESSQNYFKGNCNDKCENVNFRVFLCFILFSFPQRQQSYSMWALMLVQWSEEVEKHQPCLQAKKSDVLYDYLTQNWTHSILLESPSSHLGGR